MDSRTKWSWLAVLLSAACLGWPLAPRASAQEAVLVGRIAYEEGQVLRYVPDTQDWVATIQDAPFGIHDALYSDPHARAECIMPNGLWVRIGASTQIQLIALKNDASEVDIASGVTRFYNKSAHGVVKATTPFGYVLAEPHATFDLYVGDQSMEVIALQGDIAFIHQAHNARYDVVPGGASIMANATEVTSGDGNLDAAWDDWNATRDSVWTQRVQARGESVRHVPPQLHDDAYALEENGRWERVYYEGAYHEFWRPTTVAGTWQPFTAGRWTDWYGDQCWVPEEPFGYVTHHYGNWVVVHDAWYWAPPVATGNVTTGPLLGFAWYPGRVAWIHSDVAIGWVPLAPTEVYYAHRAWGPRAVVVTSVPTVSISIGSLAFAKAAVVVPQTALYTVPTYRAVRVTNISQTTIVNHFRPAPVVNTTVINNYTQVTNRYNFTNVTVTAKPHSQVVARITQNQQLATQQAPTVNAAALTQTLATTRPAAPVQQAAVPPPTVTSKIVPANQVHAPVNQVHFQPVEVKQHLKPATASPAGQPAAGARPGAPGAQPPSPGTPGGQPRPPGTPPPQLGQPTPPTSPRPGTLGAQPQPGAPGTPPAQPSAPSIASPRPQPGTPGAPPHPPGTPRPQPGQPTPRWGTPGAQPQPSAPGTPPARPGIQPPTLQSQPRSTPPPPVQQQRPPSQPPTPHPQPVQPPTAQPQPRPTPPAQHHQTGQPPPPTPPAQHQQPAPPPPTAQPQPRPTPPAQHQQPAPSQQQPQQKKKPGEEQPKQP